MFDAAGKPVGLAIELARGGEGAVFDIAGRPTSVAKIYLKPPDRAKAEKIIAMVGMATDRLTALSAWPTATLHLAGGQLAGFIMPKLTGYRPVFQVYGPKLRLKQFPKADWRFLVHTAGNAARAFEAVHASALVVGDVNHGNLLVGTDATVRFIDADSMQVTCGGHSWNCEVGVSTHQPPEMQGLASYRDVARTANHDAFGLAVIIFQLLCMDRHPFSGRYSGTGEPPDIERAITESRYAYGGNVSRTQMSPPPGSLPISALPSTIQALFKTAFAPSSALGGRPSADRWTSELDSLGKSLRRCGINAGHWHSPAAGSCPWCEVESRSGVVLFPAMFVSGRTGDGVVLLWQEIQALRDPGPLPLLQRPVAWSTKPSSRVQAAQRRLRARKLLTAATLVVGVALVWAVVPATSRLAPLLAVAALAAGFWWFRQPQEAQEVRATLADACSLWTELERKWVPGPAAWFSAIRQALADFKHEHDGLAKRRVWEMQGLAANRRQQQLKAHLEGFEIATAKITGVGKAKVAMLLSYGIETAADLEMKRIEAVPGFGPKTAASLIAFRGACEASFRFDEARAVEPARIAALDGLLAQRRAKIEAELVAGLARLKTLTTEEERHRESLKGMAAELQPIYAQALADARVFGIG